MKIANFLIIIVALFLIATCSCGKIPYDVVENNPISPKVNSPAELRHHKKVLIKASENYQAGPIRRAMRGKNYREVWDAPVEVPILWLDTLHGGLKIVKEGGGGQSRSMELKDKEGHFYKLRSIGKNPTVNIPKIIMTLGMGQAIADVTSAGHPYGALAAASLSASAGLPSTHPTLYYMPKQNALDTFNERYGNRLFLLEFEPQDSQGDWVSDKLNITAMPEWEDMLKNLRKDAYHRIDQEKFLKARLLDLLIGDWDRHPGNWGWGEYQSGKETHYLPIPIDRDMTFFKLEGVIPWFVTRSFVEPRYRPYRKKIKYLPRMLDNSKPLHAIALNRMTAADFQEKAQELQQLLSDEEIEKALRTWPDTVYQLNADEVREKLLALRDDLPRYAAEFYEFISKKVEIGGTDDKETFTVQPVEKGGLRVQVMSYVGQNDAIPHYDRIFYPKETKEIVLLGLGGDDVFDIMEGCPSQKIKISIVGGQGKDKVRIESIERQPYHALQVFDEDEMEASPVLKVLKPEKENYYWLEEMKEGD